MWSNLEQVLLDYGMAIAEEYRQRLNDDNRNASYSLANSVTPFVAQEGESVVLNLSLEEHWKFLEYGTREKVGNPRGKFPPVKAIRKWIDEKPVIPLSGTKDSLAYLIARKIWREGTPAYNYLKNSVDEQYKKFGVGEKIKEAIIEDIREYIKQIIDDKQ